MGREFFFGNLLLIYYWFPRSQRQIVGDKDLKTNMEARSIILNLTPAQAKELSALVAYYSGKDGTKSNEVSILNTPPKRNPTKTSNFQN
jgi:hypothetical protein